MEKQKPLLFALVAGVVFYACSQYAGREAVKPKPSQAFEEQLSVNADSTFITIPDLSDVSVPNYAGVLYYERDTVYFVHNSITYPCYVTIGFDTLSQISYCTVSSSMLAIRDITLEDYQENFNEAHSSRSECRRECNHIGAIVQKEQQVSCVGIVESVNANA